MAREHRNSSAWVYLAVEDDTPDWAGELLQFFPFEGHIISVKEQPLHSLIIVYIDLDQFGGGGPLFGYDSSKIKGHFISGQKWHLATCR